jgi:hypothetical protein
MKARALFLLDKARAALITAIEIYNKPEYAYREETFSMLALNAWDLLLKAKVLADNNHNCRSIYAYERRTTLRGEKSTRRYIRRNRIGNPHILDLNALIAVFEEEHPSRLPPAVKANLEALTEIRANAVHYIDASPQLARLVHEIGAASISNFIKLANRWFSLDLSAYKLSPLPIGYLSISGSDGAVEPPDYEKKLIRFLQRLIRRSDRDPSAAYHVALEMAVA